MVIRAAVLEAPGQPFKVERLELAPPGKGEVRVRIRAVGVCHSDWHLVTGATKHPFPCVAGHEGSGVVEAVGDGVAELKAGDAVALNWAPSCGTCFYCLAGRPALCSAYVGPIWSGTMLDGTTRLSRGGQPVFHYCGLACHAEAVVVPEVSCVRMPSELPFESAALIGCAVATGVGAVLNTARVPKGSSVAIFGCGGVGLSAILGAGLAGASQVIAIDAAEAKRGAALGMGAGDFLKFGNGLAGAVRSLTEGRGVDYAVEATGKREVQEMAFECVRPGGTLVIAGLSPMGEPTNFPAARLVREEKTVMGSYYGTCDTARDFPEYAQLALSGQLPLEKLVTQRFGLDEINEAYRAMMEGKVSRGVIVMG